MDFPNETDSLNNPSYSPSPMPSPQRPIKQREAQTLSIQPRRSVINLQIDSQRGPSDLLALPMPVSTQNTTLYTPALSPLNIENADMTVIRLNENAENTGNNGNSTVQQDSQEPFEYKAKELTNIYLIEAVVFFSLLGIGLIWILIMPKFNYFAVPIYGVILIYLIFLLLLNALWTSQVIGDSWPESAYALKFIDTFCGCVCAVLACLAHLKVFPICKVSGLPFIISIIYTAVYWKKISKNKWEVCIRLYYIIQMALIGLKFDHDVECDWNIILLPTIAYAIVLMSSEAVFASDIKQKIDDPNFRQNSSLSIRTRKIGLFWHILKFCFAFFMFIAVFCVAQALTSNDRHLAVQIISGFLFIVAVAQIALTGVFWGRMMRFIITYELIYIQPTRIETDNTKTISFKVRKYNTYFAKLSSTYYVSLSKSLTMKNQQNIDQIKNTLHSLKVTKTASGLSNASTSTKGQDNVSSVNRSMVEIESSEKPIFFDEENRFCPKLAHSVNDIDNFLEVCPKENEDENLCCICYKNLSDVIMANCGHGGLCYDCATELLKKKDNCMVCRKRVGALYKIDPIPKFSNVFKGIELSKMVIGCRQVII